MNHQMTSENNILDLCGKNFAEREYMDFNKYWDNCGGWYEERGISEEEFSKFPLKEGFAKGDILLVWGRFTPKVGDIIIFYPNKESLAPRPIVHRIMDITDGVLQTKGDHNQAQLSTSNNALKTDETHIEKDQIIGKVILRIPLLGWIKILFTNIFQR